MSKTESVALFSADGFRLRSADGYYLYASLDEVLNNVEKVSQIPRDAKQAVKEFIDHHFDALCEAITDLDSFEFPSELISKFPEFVEYIQLAFGLFI